MLNGSEKSRQTLVEYVMKEKSANSQIFYLLCSSKTPLPMEDLLTLEEHAKESRERRAILSQVFRHKPPTGLDRFRKDLESSFVYMDFRRNLSPELVTQLQPWIEQASGEAKDHLRLLNALGQKDPIVSLLSLLRDPSWANKNLVMFELARLADPRAVSVVAQVLRESSKDFFGTKAESDDEWALAVTYGLKAVAYTGTAESIRELIGLLRVDLARFGEDTYYDRARFQQITTIHLMELTGESFGTDADKWQKWQEAYPTHSVPRELANPSSYYRTNAQEVIDLGQ
jgi:hypothetical protein